MSLSWTKLENISRTIIKTLCVCCLLLIDKSRAKYVCDTEEGEHGVGAGVNATILSETLQVLRIGESVFRATFRL
jgi:hypothetical protein